ncbi:MAG TPA: hypothetical protein VMA13_07030 [Candidatus Saccharimonadales bacterium]|nr:hypothetical protein [Candidatus Saccharimonadales bacterium]
MPQPLNVKILPNDVYRIIEALEYLAESWKATEVCCRDGIILDDAPIHVDCSDPAIAHSEALAVKGVLRRLHRQLDKTGDQNPTAAVRELTSPTHPSE